MKKIIKHAGITLFDVHQSLENGWIIGTHKEKLCLENEKTIFLPNRMPKP